MRRLLCMSAYFFALIGDGVAALGRSDPAPFSASDCDGMQGMGTLPSFSQSSGKSPSSLDMITLPEGVPHGTIDALGRRIGWANGPRVWRGKAPLPGWRSIIATGMIYASEVKPSSHGVRVQVRDLRLFVKLSNANLWCQLDHVAAPNGAKFVENFDGNEAIDKEARLEPSGGESIKMVEGRNFHFWGNRVLIPDQGISGVYVQYAARLVADSTGSPAEVRHAAYLGAASADYWKSQSSPAGYVNVLNEDVAIARFKALKGRWRLFTMNAAGGKAQAPSMP